MLYGDMDFSLPTPVLYKISTKAKIQMVNRGEGPVHQTFMQEPPCQVPSVARHALSHWLWYNIILVGQLECISSEHFSEGCLSWTRTVYLSGVPDFFDRNKILSGGDLSHYQVPHCIRVLFYFVWFVFIHHNF